MPDTGSNTTAPARRARPLRSGIHTISAERYHADPCSKPSLSASIAKVICTETPAHAWVRHPRLNPDFQREEKTTFDVGTAAHAMLLEGKDVITGVDAKDWRTKDAQAQRDAIREVGRIPLLMHQYEQVIELVERIGNALADLDMWPIPLTGGKAERTIIWREGTGNDGVWLRGLVDWLRDDLVAFDDLKTTTRGAHPLTWADRRMWDNGLDVQAAFYQRGLKALTGETVEPRFVIVESVPPYAVTVLGLSPSVMELAHSKVQYAIDTWRHCMKTGHWPGYGGQVHYAELPAWQATRWLEERYIEDEGGDRS